VNTVHHQFPGKALLIKAEGHFEHQYALNDFLFSEDVFDKSIPKEPEDHGQGIPRFVFYQLLKEF
jgi:hypothetical protein